MAEFTKALREHPNNREAQLGLQRAKLRASEAHLVTGRRLYAQGKFDEAVLELQLSAELNPLERRRRARGRDRSQGAPHETLDARGRTNGARVAARSASRDFVAPGAELPNVTLPTAIATGRLTTIRELYLTIATYGKISRDVRLLLP